MNFINPKIDYAFKKIFGNDQHKDVLISFLNAILHEGKPTIQSLEIIDPYNAPKLSKLKDTFLDVRARLNDGTYTIIEMQVLAVHGFAKRVLYNLTKAYSIQLKPKEDYDTLTPVIGLTITNFKMFSKKQVNGVLSRFALYDQEHKLEYPMKDIELVFVELTKFKKKLEELETIMDKWLYFLRYADELEDVPAAMKGEPAIDEAFQIANFVNMNQEEMDELEKRKFFTRDMQKLAEAARKAEQKGMEKGMEKGKKEKAIEIAQQLLDVLDDETISQKTGLSLEEVQNLRTPELKKL